MIYAPQAEWPSLVATVRNADVYIQVIAGTVRVSNLRDTLVTPGPENELQGLRFSPTMGVTRLRWTGDFWIIGDTGTELVNIEIVEAP